MVMSKSNTTTATSSEASLVVVLGSALCGAAAYAVMQRAWTKNGTKRPDPETDYSVAHGLVWAGIGGAMNASQLYIGDRLQLYSALRDMCAEPGSAVTVIALAKETGYNQRWLREWLAQQAAMGVLLLLPGTGDSDDDLRYRLPWATAEVLANPDSPEYDISMISGIPSLVNRAKTMLPEAFATGIGRPYDEPEVAAGIDRHHVVEIRDIFFPTILPSANKGLAVKAMQTQGCKVADLGCGAGNLVLAMAKAFPNCRVDGYEVSEQALSIGATNLIKSKLKNAFLVDANEDPLGSHKHEYDVITTFDVLHDAPNPAALIQEVKAALKPGGVWLLADIASKATIRDNIASNSAAGTQLAFSTCLCMACSLSTPDGAGLGTLGFTVPVAEKMLREGGFEHVRVLAETKKNTRWFEVM